MIRKQFLRLKIFHSKFKTKTFIQLVLALAESENDICWYSIFALYIVTLCSILEVCEWVDQSVFIGTASLWYPSSFSHTSHNKIDVIRYCNDKLNQEQLFWALLGALRWVVKVDTLLPCNDPIFVYETDNNAPSVYGESRLLFRCLHTS